jgi:protein O-mannosyl-transferase
MAKVVKGKNIQVKSKQKAIAAKPPSKINWMVVVIIAMCFALYADTLPNHYAMDDELATSTTNNVNDRVSLGIKGIPGIFTSLYSEGKLKYEYRPIVKATYAIENQIFGVNPHVSHFINILLYAITCLLLFKVLKRLMKEYNIWFIFFTVIIFLAHPVHTEVVASLKNRDELLSFIFSLVTLNYLISYTKTDRLMIRRVLSLVMAFFFYLLAYLSKASALVFLAVFPLVLYFFTDISWKKLLLIFGVILVAVILSRYGPKTFLPKPDRDVFLFENPLFKYKGLLVRIATGIMGLLFYLKILFYPHPLLFYYGYDMIPISHLSDGWVIIGILLHLALFLFALWKIKQKHILSFAILYYLICISMFANIVKPAMGIVADRFVYAASLGFCMVIAYFIFKLMKKDVKLSVIPRKDRMKLLLPLILLLIPYSVKTIARNTSWKDHTTLYTNDIKYLDNSAKANALIAGQLMAEMSKMLYKGQTPPSLFENLKTIIGYYERSIEIYPEYYSSYNNIGSIYFTIYGNNAAKNGDTLKARQYYRTGIGYFNKALSINPDYPEALYNIAYSYEMVGSYDTAIVNYRKNLLVKPDNIKSMSNMANLYFNKFDNYDSAVAITNRMMEVNSESDIPYINMGTYSLKRGDTLAAIENYELAMEKFPKNFDLAGKLSNYYAKKDPEKSLKYQKMFIDGKKKFLESQ